MQKLSKEEMKKVLGGTGDPPPGPIVCWVGFDNTCPANNCCYFDHQSTGPTDPDGICAPGNCNIGPM